MIEWLLDPDIVLAFITLTALEVVLGVDNIVFISVIVSRAPLHLQKRIRMVGLSMAMLMRIALLFLVSWIMTLQEPLVEVLGHGVSVRDLILIVGGLFLLTKATNEIHTSLETDVRPVSLATASATLITLQILVIDLVFSIDSIITAIGMATHIEVMIAAVVCAVIIMMLLSGYISEVIENHPTLKMLALSFLLLIGMSLVGDGLGIHIPKGYLYFAMGFSIFVEILNLRLRKSHNPVELKVRFDENEKLVRSEN